MFIRKPIEKLFLLCLLLCSALGDRSLPGCECCESSCYVGSWSAPCSAGDEETEAQCLEWGGTFCGAPPAELPSTCSSSDDSNKKNDQPIATSGSCETICGMESAEPISEEVKQIRGSSSCVLPSSEVDAVEAGNSGNPANVKIVEKIMDENLFNEYFPNRNSAYTYRTFLQAIAKFPAICVNEEICRKTLANMFSQFRQEVADLFYIEEIDNGQLDGYCATWGFSAVAFPCQEGKQYFGRGAKQLSWNYNYGAFSQAMFGDKMILLKNPELVATTWLNFAAAMWFFVTPQPPKPSMLHVIDGTWKPNAHDKAGNLAPGLGATIQIINGLQECGTDPSNANAASNRKAAYVEYAQKLNVDISGEKLHCRDMAQFDEHGAAGSLGMYWSKDLCEAGATDCKCQLVWWQGEFSALVEGNYARCNGLEYTCTDPNQTSAPTKKQSPSPTALVSAKPTTGKPTKTGETRSPTPSPTSVSVFPGNQDVIVLADAANGKLFGLSETMLIAIIAAGVVLCGLGVYCFKACMSSRNAKSEQKAKDIEEGPKQIHTLATTTTGDLRVAVE